MSLREARRHACTDRASSLMLLLITVPSQLCPLLRQSRCKAAPRKRQATITQVQPRSPRGLAILSVLQWHKFPHKGRKAAKAEIPQLFTRRKTARVKTKQGNLMNLDLNHGRIFSLLPSPPAELESEIRQIPLLCPKHFWKLLPI